MTSKMLIDASHPEETRVVVTKGNRIEEFDFESASRKQLRGNIYLAKVTRVEPSLQAAFIDFGGNRHGFLAFSEIHPDYYQIPMADRQALLDEEARASSEDEEESEERKGRRGGRRRSRRGERTRRAPAGESVSEAVADAETAENGEAGERAADAAENGENGENGSFAEADHGYAGAADTATDEGGETGDNGDNGDADDNGDNGDGPEEVIEQIGGADALEEVPQRVYRPRKQYKIQEVIKRRQILLVQVVKEERGNKGAALTTYLSLAGRYSVLMPNTARGGGISRKITSSTDRKRLKEIATDLEVPDGMGVILRTAGAARTKTEVKRDFEYLMRLWESVRELTLQSTAPALVYEEGSLIKRAIRDLYSKEVEEVLVAGDDGYREAKDFMKMLMPSHAKMVKPYKEPQPLFARHGVEQQLDAMFHNVVQLRSGGYIVINQTEALVAIDVNSGRATREHNIEDTALKTNLEAAEEVSRQLRLRDLAGLIVIDFIDMEEKRNNRAVERKLNDCLKNDRARIQLGRISHFGLLEMSRQRIRTGVLESSTSPCPHCAGTGLRRSTASIALNLVRALEEALMKNSAYDMIVRTPVETALYVLNHKREMLMALEGRFGVSITLRADETILPPQYHAFERGELSTRPVEIKPTVNVASIAPEDIEEADEAEADEAETADEAEAGQAAAEGRPARDDDGGRRRRRRRRRRGGRNGDGEAFNADGQDTGTTEAADGEASDDDQADGAGPNAEAAAEGAEGAETSEDGDKPRRRRRRRGGRRNRRENEDATAEAGEADSEGDGEEAPEAAPAARRIEINEPELRDDAAPEAVVHHIDGTLHDVVVTRPDIAEADEGPVPTPAKKPEPIIEEEPVDPNRPKRSGWWAKAKKAVTGE